MGKNSSQLGHLHAKVDNKENEMCALSHKLEALKKEFGQFAETIEGSENNLWGDVCLIQVKFFLTSLSYSFTTFCPASSIKFISI
jgi:hypothetical protein